MAHMFCHPLGRAPPWSCLESMHVADWWFWSVVVRESNVQLSIGSAVADFGVAKRGWKKWRTSEQAGSVRHPKRKHIINPEANQKGEWRYISMMFWQYILYHLIYTLLLWISWSTIHVSPISTTVPLQEAGKPGRNCPLTCSFQGRHPGTISSFAIDFTDVMVLPYMPVLFHPHLLDILAWLPCYQSLNFWPGANRWILVPNQISSRFGLPHWRRKQDPPAPPTNLRPRCDAFLLV